MLSPSVFSSEKNCVIWDNSFPDTEMFKIGNENQGVKYPTIPIALKIIPTITL